MVLPKAIAVEPQRRGAQSLVDTPTSSETIGPQPIMAAAMASRRQSAKAAVNSEAAGSLPKTASGKPQRRGTKRRADTPQSSGTTLAQPHGAVDAESRRREAARSENTATTQPPAELTTDQICLRLLDLQRKRIFCIVSQSRSDRAMQAAIAKCLGYDPNADEAGRKAMFKAAGAIIKAVEAGKSFDMPDHVDSRTSLDSFLPLIPASAQSRLVWDDIRNKTEAEMRKLARGLPAFEWVSQNAKGVGDLGLARIVAEATSRRQQEDGLVVWRTIGDIETHEKLWKRMGVAVVGEERQQKKGDKIDALLHGYSPRRRAELWSVCSDTMFRQQWRGVGNDPENPDPQGRPVGPYGEVYRARKASVMERVDSTDSLPFSDKRKWTRKRADMDARRVMSKEFLKDLWRVWHGMEARHPARFAALQEPRAA